MKSLSLMLLLSIFCTTVLNAEEKVEVIFKSKAPEKFEHEKQQVTFLGCNTEVNKYVDWKDISKVSVGSGHQQKRDSEFFINRYYLASPPLPNPNQKNENDPFILGLLFDDHFDLTALQDTKDIRMDYTLLKPVYLKYVSVNFSSDCVTENFDLIPINTHCPSFPQNNAHNRPAKGIGFISGNKEKAGNKNMLEQGKIFIPVTDAKGLKPLQCSVSILNDIILEREVYFGTAQHHTNTIDLTKVYQSGKPIDLYCKPRPKDKPPVGCMATFEE